jgi:hypothetical protein
MKIRVISLLMMAGFLNPVGAQSAEVLKAPRYATQGAELPRCRGQLMCDATGCFPSPACRPRPVCPPGNPCYSLYGAYGPYGGTHFWGAYTAAGW